MRGWGIEERGQSDVSAYSRAKERIVTVCAWASGVRTKSGMWKGEKKRRCCVWKKEVRVRCAHVNRVGGKSKNITPSIDHSAAAEGSGIACIIYGVHSWSESQEGSEKGAYGTASWACLASWNKRATWRSSRHSRVCYLSQALFAFLMNSIGVWVWTHMGLARWVCETQQVSSK